MKNILNTAANVGTVVVCCLLSVALARNLFYANQPGAVTTTSIDPYAEGDTVSELPGFQSTESDYTLFFVLRSTCPYCTSSMPFYRRLVDATATLPIQLAVVAVEPVEVVKEYLAKHQLAIVTTLSVKPGDFPVAGTPTLILADRNRKISKVWVGQLNTEAEAELMGTLSSLGQQASTGN